MKKAAALFIVLIMVFSLAACSGSSQKSGSEDKTTETSENTSISAAEQAYIKDGNIIFRAFLELTGEELVSLAEGQGYEKYENENVMTGFADRQKSNGLQKNFYGSFIQVYNSPTDYWSYETIKSAGKGELAKMAVAFNVKGEYANGQDAMPGIFDGLEIVGSWKDPNDEKGSGAVRIKDGSGTEYLGLYTTEFYSGAPAAVSIIVRTDAYFAANPFAGASSIETVWSQNYS